MWKTGVQWSMEEGVKCRVEMVNNSMGLVVLTKSKQDRHIKCLDILNKITLSVMEAKEEFCRPIKPNFFLLDSTSRPDYLSEDNCFAMSDVKRVLFSFGEKQVVVSASGKFEMECSKFLSMRKFTLWENIFHIELATVLCYLEDVVRNLHLLGIHLGLLLGVLDTIEINFPVDVTRRKIEVVKMWMSSTLDPPSWCSLAKALKKIDQGGLAAQIEKEHSECYHDKH